MIKLSNRLQTIANYVTAGSRMADIGSDHALLPTYLLQRDKCASAIAGELNTGPFLAAEKQAADAGLTDKLEVRQGDGLAVLKPGEADTVTIAGMGGGLMRDILEAGYAAGKLEGVRELVLQPNVAEDAVRRWLADREWYLEDETIIEEDGKIYEIMHAVKTDNVAEKNRALYDAAFLPLALDEEALLPLMLRMGPHLLRRREQIMVKKWQLELKKLERICKQMSESDLPESVMKLEQFRTEIKRIEEVLACLSTAKH